MPAVVVPPQPRNLAEQLEVLDSDDKEYYYHLDSVEGLPTSTEESSGPNSLPELSHPISIDQVANRFLNADRERLRWWNRADMTDDDPLPPFLDVDMFPRWDEEYWFDSVNQLLKKIFWDEMTRSWVKIFKDPSTVEETDSSLEPQDNQEVQQETELETVPSQSSDTTSSGEWSDHGSSGRTPSRSEAEEADFDYPANLIERNPEWYRGVLQDTRFMPLPRYVDEYVRPESTVRLFNEEFPLSAKHFRRWKDGARFFPDAQ